MGLFGKKGKSRDELIAEAQELNEEDVGTDEKKSEVSTGNGKIDIELTKIQGRLEGLDEVRKASSERFSRIAEQVGELRGMIMDTNKAMGKVEVSATKAVDLVESVHPEKLMIEVRKQDGKIESLRAAIESNDAIMKDVMLEMKKIRNKMDLYKGVEQVMQLNDEIKQELATIKKVEATIERHSDKVETIFVEVEKKFKDFEQFNSVVKDLDKSFKRLASDFEKVRAKVETKLDRKEFIDLLNRFNEFEQHTTNLMKLLDERNKTVRGDLEAQFKRLVQEYQKRLDGMRPSMKARSPQSPVEPSGSGEDMAGGDARQGLMTRVSGGIKGLFSRKEGELQDAGEQDELFPANEEGQDASPEEASGTKSAGSAGEQGTPAEKRSAEESPGREEG